MEKKKFDNEILLPEVARLISGGHSVTIPVRGNSMGPFLADRRDRVTLGGFVPDDLQPGVTVLARETGGRIVLHRIIARSGDRLILQGDGNLRQTEETAPGIGNGDGDGCGAERKNVCCRWTGVAHVLPLVGEAGSLAAVFVGYI